MKIENKIDKYLNEKVMSLEELANEIEDMDLNVNKKYVSAFDKTLEKYLKSVDPKNNLSIKDAVIKLGINKARKLYNDLLEYRYDD